VRHARTSTGLQPYVGTLWWQYADNWDERVNWGLVTLLDNAYDGHEDVEQTVNCSAPLQNLACGGERRDYGDLISSVEQANLGLTPDAAQSAWLERRSVSLLGLSVLSVTVAAAYAFFRPSASSRQ
jgi:hypothetical protein